MSFIAAIDISTFIWCKNDYETNKHQYYGLLNVIPLVYEKIKLLKLPVLLREELYKLIISEFPYNMAREISNDFEHLTLSFLVNTDWIQYENNEENKITSFPVLVKPYLSNGTQIETQNQICHLFMNGENPTHKFISYSHFYNHDKNLLLKKQIVQKEIETLIYTSEKEIEQFFDQFKIKFQHNFKHRKESYYDYDRSENVSPFSSYHYQGEVEAQKLLDEAFFFDGYYYNFDLKNDVYVRFLNTGGLIFHGHDLSDEAKYLPTEVKKKFNKNGRKF